MVVCTQKKIMMYQPYIFSLQCTLRKLQGYAWKAGKTGIILFLIEKSTQVVIPNSCFYFYFFCPKKLPNKCEGFGIPKIWQIFRA